jgi:methylmalonyl-CoA/ethylmalonyl-CoA epimerase
VKLTTIKRIDHIAIVVEDIEAALGFWRDTLGLDLRYVEDVQDQQSIVAFLPIGNAEVELVKPTSDDSGVARYLKKRGPGVHHICFEVDDIEKALDELKNKGIRLINESPMIGTGGKKIAFIHPESTHGVLIELYELTQMEPVIRLQRAASLADRVINSGQVMRAATLAFLRALRQNSDNGSANEEMLEDQRR